MSTSGPPGGIPITVETEARATSIWSKIDERIRGMVMDLIGIRRYRGASMNVPFGRTTPLVGYFVSVGVTFNCRIVGYVISALTPGTIVLDIRRSRYTESPVGDEPVHPDVFQLPGTELPALNGTWVENMNLSGWTSTELLDGDILHFYVESASGIAEALLILRLQDLDAQVSSNT